MIKNITTGMGLQVSSSYSNWPSFYNTISGTGNNLLGQVRYNGSSQNLEVYDGTSWLTLTSLYPTIELQPHVQAVVAWAQNRMVEEERMKELAKSHPAVADALAARERADEAVRIAVALCDVQ